MEEERKDLIAQEIGNNIYTLRKSKKLSREKLAEYSNLSPHYIYYLEKGKYLPGCIAIIDLCNALDTTPSQLLSSSLNMNINLFCETIKEDFSKLTDYDKKVLIDLVKSMSNHRSHL